MAFWNWSRTAATNATADPTIVWSEGQAPSSVNDSARAMMARTAEWRDDISGTITTGGSSTNYTLTSNQGFTSFANMHGAMISFIPHITCGSPVSLNVDGLGSKPLQGVPAIELGAGTLIQGTPYVATYYNSFGGFVLHGFYANPYSIPIGGLMPYLGASAPNSNFVLPFGQAISRTTYTTLFSLVSTTFGGGDGSTTFNVPDLRGRAIFGQDNMGGSAAGIMPSVLTDNGTIVGTTIGSKGGTPTHVLTGFEMPIHNHTITDVSHTHTFSAPQTNAQSLSSGGNSGPDAAVKTTLNTGSAFTGITGTNNAGGNNAFSMLNPAMILPYILRVI